MSNPSVVRIFASISELSLALSYLLKKLRLPARMGTKALLKTVNTLYTYEEFLHLVEDSRGFEIPLHPSRSAG